MTVGDYLRFAGELRGMAGARRRRAACPRSPTGRTSRRPRRPDRHALARLPPARRRRPGDRPPAEAPHPRRADPRPRPGADRRDAQAHPRAQGRAHGPDLEPHPLRDQPDLRSPARARRRRDRRLRHRGGAVARHWAASRRIESTVVGARRHRRGRDRRCVARRRRRRPRSAVVRARATALALALVAGERRARRGRPRAGRASGHRRAQARPARSTELETIFLRLVEGRRPCAQLASSIRRELGGVPALADRLRRSPRWCCSSTASCSRRSRWRGEQALGRRAPPVLLLRRAARR